MNVKKVLITSGAIIVSATALLTATPQPASAQTEQAQFKKGSPLAQEQPMKPKPGQNICEKITSRIKLTITRYDDGKVLQINRYHKIIDRLENLARKTVIGRVGTPEEIAHAIYFLADNAQSSFMTGQALIVDGGATARLSTE